MRIQAAKLCVVDSNSTRTESCVNIRPDPAAPSRVDAPKAADYSGYRQIMRPSRGMRAGLKILVSAVQSRPSPPFHSHFDAHLHSHAFQHHARMARTLGRNLGVHGRPDASLIGMTVRTTGPPTWSPWWRVWSLTPPSLSMASSAMA